MLLHARSHISERAGALYEKIIEKDVLAFDEYRQCARSKTIENLLIQYVIPRLGGTSGRENAELAGELDTGANATRLSCILAQLLVAEHCDLSTDVLSATLEFFHSKLKKIRYDNQEAVNVFQALHAFLRLYGHDVLQEMPTIMEKVVATFTRALTSTCGNNKREALKHESVRLVTLLISMSSEAWLRCGENFFTIMKLLEPHRQPVPDDDDAQNMRHTYMVAIQNLGVLVARTRPPSGNDDAIDFSWRATVHDTVFERALVAYSVWGRMFRYLLHMQYTDTDINDKCFAAQSSLLLQKLTGVFQDMSTTSAKRGDRERPELSSLRCASDLSAVYARVQATAASPATDEAWKQITKTLLEWTRTRTGLAAVNGGVPYTRHEPFECQVLETLCDIIENCEHTRREYVRELAMLATAIQEAFGTLPRAPALRFMSVATNCSRRMRQANDDSHFRLKMLSVLDCRNNVWLHANAEVITSCVLSIVFGDSHQVRSDDDTPRLYQDYVRDDLSSAAACTHDNDDEKGRGGGARPSSTEPISSVSQDVAGMLYEQMACGYMLSLSDELENPVALLRVAGVSMAISYRISVFLDENVFKNSKVCCVLFSCLRKATKYIEKKLMQERVAEVRSVADFDALKDVCNSMHESFDFLLRHWSMVNSCRVLPGHSRAPSDKIQDELAASAAGIEAALKAVLAGTVSSLSTDGDEAHESMNTIVILSNQVRRPDVRDYMLLWLCRMLASFSRAFPCKAKALERDMLVVGLQLGSWVVQKQIIDLSVVNLSTDLESLGEIVSSLQTMIIATAKAEKIKWVYFLDTLSSMAKFVTRNGSLCDCPRFIREMFVGGDSPLNLLEEASVSRPAGMGEKKVPNSSPKAREAEIRFNVELIVTVLSCEWPDGTEIDITAIVDDLHLSSRMLELIDSLRDTHGGVRMCAARVVPRLYVLFDGSSSIIRMHPMQFFDAACARIAIKYRHDEMDVDGEKELASAPTPLRHEEHMSNIAFLRESAVSCGIVEATCITILCGHAALFPENEEAVCGALDEIAAALGYANRKALLLFHDVDITMFFASSGCAAAEFVDLHFVLGYTSKRDFLRAWSPRIVSAYSFHKLSCDGRVLAKLERVEPKALLENAFGSLFAQCAVGRLAWKDIQGILESLGVKDTVQMLRQKQARIIEELALRTRKEGDGSEASEGACYNSVEASYRAIEKVRDSAATTSSGERGSSVSTKLSQVAVSTILHRQRRYILSLAALRHKNAYHGLFALVQWLNDRAFSPKYFRSILLIFLEMIVDGCYGLCEIMERMLLHFDQTASEVHVSHMTDTLQYVASKLWILMDKLSGTTTISSRERSDVETLFRYVADRDALRERLSFIVFEQHVNSFHSTEETLSRIAQQSAAGFLLDPSAPTHIGHVFKRVIEQLHRVPGDARRRIIAQLDRQYNLLLLATTNTAEGSRFDDVLSSSEIQKIIWRMVDISAREHSRALANVAGRELAARGDIHARSAAFTHPLSISAYADLEEEQGDFVDSTAFMEALAMLSNNLYDDRLDTVDAAQATAMYLAEIPSVRTVMQDQLAVDVEGELNIESFVYFLGPYFAQNCTPFEASSHRDVPPAGSHDEIRTWWNQACAKPFEAWITHVVGHLIIETSDAVLFAFRRLAALNVQLAEKLLPMIFLDIAKQNKRSVCRNLSNCMSEYFQDVTRCIDDRCVSALIEALDFVRYYNQSQRRNTRSKNKAPGIDSVWTHAYWFEVDYLVAATAANACGKCFSALMLVEEHCRAAGTWRGHISGHRLITSDAVPDSRVPAEHCPPNEDQRVANGSDFLESHVYLLFQIYRTINEADSIYSLAESHNDSVQLALAEHEGRWLDAIEICNAQLEDHNLKYVPSGGSMQRQLKAQKESQYLRCLKNIGNFKAVLKYELSDEVWKSPIEDVLLLDDLRSECAWRLGEWSSLASSSYARGMSSVPVSHALDSQSGAGTFNATLVTTLQALESGDKKLFDKTLVMARSDVVLRLGARKEEGTHTVNTAIIRLQILDELSASWHFLGASQVVRSASVSSEDENERNAPWCTSSYIAAVDRAQTLNEARDILRERVGRVDTRYDLLEPFIALCSRLVKMHGKARLCVLHFFAVANVARKASKHADAMAAIHFIKDINWEKSDVPEEWKLQTKFEEAKLMWSTVGGTRRQAALALAVKICQSLQRGTDDDAVSWTPWKVNALSIVGKWLGHARKEHSKDILDSYLFPARDASLNVGDTSTTEYRAHMRLAQYADEVHCQAKQRIASPEYMKRLSRGDLQGYASAKNGSDRIAVKRRKLMTQHVKRDADELESRCKDMALVAVQAYRSCLLLGSKHDLRSVMRLCSLWLSDISDAAVNDEVRLAIESLPSYKFVPLIHQLASRIQLDDTAFQRNLKTLIMRLLRDHPHHSMCHIYALKNLAAVDDRMQAQKAKVARHIWDAFHETETSLATDAETLIDFYKKINAVLRARFKRTSVGKGMVCTDSTWLPRDVRSAMKPLPRVHIFTLPLAVDETCNYGQTVIGFEAFENKFEWMDGINSTKKITTIGTDGKSYMQIGKFQCGGVDDLRQDAVMQQLFGLVNTFFRMHRECHLRKLRMRTYKVVPFSPTSGILEFVEHCRPFANVATDTHVSYRPRDWPPDQCRRKMRDIHEQNIKLKTGSSSTRPAPRKEITAFTAICDRFKPAFHNFFLERFPSPSTWFEMRLSYTRSVAASSMITYLVGLGDRHASNILIDETSAEVIHIDHGIAFEQGKLLELPETVPFRLTRDMVDGMGITGVDGVMRQCCEHTMNVLREHKDELLTIVEVLLYDPLYSWTLTKQKAAARQNEDDHDDGVEEPLILSEKAEHDNASSSETFEASTVLQRIREKLDGIEMGEVLDVRSQVQRLLQEATDPERLAFLFYGWQAWL